jgi:hypothetical protein
MIGFIINFRFSNSKKNYITGFIINFKSSNLREN